MRGWCLGRGLACCLLLLCLHCFLSEAVNSIAGDDYVYEVKQGGEVCLYASFKLMFTVSYINQTKDSEILSTVLTVPANYNVTVGGSCLHNVSVLQLQWMKNGSAFEATLTFVTDSKKWYLDEMAFKFDSSNGNLFPDFMVKEEQTVSSERREWFNRTFTTDEYFYCKSCKMIRFANCSSDSGNCSSCASAVQKQPGGKNKTVTQCSEVEMERAVIFLGDFNKTHPSKRLCLEDYIALQEIIVPIVVGGALALLLVLISVAYVIAYIRRKTKERKTAQYEPVGGDY